MYIILYRYDNFPQLLKSCKKNENANFETLIMLQLKTKMQFNSNVIFHNGKSNLM